MKLIKELNEEIQVIKEESTDTGKKSLVIEGVFLQSNIKNRNGRTYPSHILEREVNRYNENYVQKNRAWGELGHPETPTVNLDRASHRIVSLKQEGNNYIGRARIIDANPMGAIVRGLLEDGGKLGVSSRGLGTLKENNGVMEVQEDFFLATAADIVSDPSAPDAFVNGIMENVEWVWNNGTLKPIQLESLENTKKELKTKTVRQIQEEKLQIFEKFLKSL